MQAYRRVTNVNQKQNNRFSSLPRTAILTGLVALSVFPQTAQAQRGGGMPMSRPAPSFSPPSRPTATNPSTAGRPTYSLPSQGGRASTPSYSPVTGGSGFGSNGVNNNSSRFSNSELYRPYYAPRTQGSGTLTNPGVNSSQYNYGNYGYGSGNRYHNSAEGFRYRYGQPYHGGYNYGNSFNYFSGGLAYYPYYSPFYQYGYTYPSLYSSYYGVLPPYITLGGAFYNPPQYVYVPYPVYQDGAYQGYRNDDVDGYYLNRNQGTDNGDGSYRIGERNTSKAAPKDAALESALKDIREAWQSDKIDPLSKHVRRDAKIAVYLRGKYQYSLDSGEYLDLTKDAISTTKTVTFVLDTVQRKQNNVYTVTGRHVYRDKDDKEHTVLVTYVLEKADGEYVITQVGTAPEKVSE